MELSSRNRNTFSSTSQETNTSTQRHLIIQDIKIEQVKEAKYLGVMFDQKLKFHRHIQQAMKKGSKLALALAGIARGKWGPEFKHMRRLFTAVIAPRMDYAAAICITRKITGKHQQQSTNYHQSNENYIGMLHSIQLKSY